MFLKDFEAKNLEDISVITHARGSVHAEKKRDFSEKDLKETDRQTDRQTERERESKASLKASIGRILFKHLTQQHATERSFVFPFYPKYDDDENAFVHVADHLYYRTISKLSKKICLCRRCKSLFER